MPAGGSSRVDPERAQVAEVGERVADRRHLPVEDRHDAGRRRRRVHHVAEPEVAVHDRRRRRVGQVLAQPAADALDGRQLARAVALPEPAEALELALEVAVGPAEALQPGGAPVDGVQRHERVDQLLAHAPAPGLVVERRAGPRRSRPRPRAAPSRRTARRSPRRRRRRRARAGPARGPRARAARAPRAARRGRSAAAGRAAGGGRRARRRRGAARRSRWSGRRRSARSRARPPPGRARRGRRAAARAPAAARARPRRPPRACARCRRLRSRAGSTGAPPGSRTRPAPTRPASRA